MAAEVGELLESVGHDHIHAGTKEDAEALVEAGNFCYALLDLAIKATADSIKPRVEAGESLLDFVRERYPNRNEADFHRLPILMVSGHSETRYVVSTLQSRADDFIVKPIGENQPPFREKIQNALRRSGREKHEQCAAVMRLARAGEAPTVASSSAPTRLEITGRHVGKRIEARAGDTVLRLTPASCVMLLKLVIARSSGGPGWVHKTELGATADTGWKGMTRLREDLADVLAIEGDGSGRFRIADAADIAGIDPVQLDALDDPQISKLAAELRRLRGSR